ncbi:hypothetical protein A2165_02140 [Candidatus Curtissbacteria bacterium RBG_13_40_7]|uniref:Uncharacterized protein n=1 Tax=Candidatus Curtissbacteria bacterium RBG_13_40_7 TaxID=1797706 RepID=A0A1F5FYV2_9BACT|nr:MAG: hypothetical protein A2165_02140 [Candidatus Curtissbacteria bacterium RBG_13_40_7]
MTQEAGARHSPKPTNLETIAELLSRKVGGLDVFLVVDFKDLPGIHFVYDRNPLVRDIAFLDERELIVNLSCFWEPCRCVSISADVFRLEVESVDEFLEIADKAIIAGDVGHFENTKYLQGQLQRLKALAPGKQSP